MRGETKRRLERNKTSFLGVIVRLLENTAHRHTDGVMDGEFLAADVEGVECVGAVL